MNTNRFSTGSAGVLFATLGALALSGCVLSSVVGYGDDEQANTKGVAFGNSGGAGGTGGYGVGGYGGGGVGGAGSTSGAATILFNVGPGGFKPGGIAVDAQNVYFSDAQQSGGRIIRVPLDGSPAVALATDETLPSAVKIDGSDLYYLTKEHLKKVPVAGGAAVNVAPTDASDFSGDYSSIDTDATHVYWTSYKPQGATMRIAKAGGTPETIHGGDGYGAGIVVKGGNVFWSVLFSFTEAPTFGIRQAPVGGGAVSTFVAGEDFAPRLGIAADDTYLYWVAEIASPDKLYKAPLTGGPPVLVGESPVASSYALPNLVIDATHAYYPQSPCSIAKVALADGTAEELTFDKTVGCPLYVAADADNIYYASNLGVTKVPKNAP